MGAYEEGAEAYRRGDSALMNPFDENDAQFDVWYDGWSGALYADMPDRAENPA